MTLTVVTLRGSWTLAVAPPLVKRLMFVSTSCHTYGLKLTAGAVGQLVVIAPRLVCQSMPGIVQLGPKL